MWRRTAAAVLSIALVGAGCSDGEEAGPVPGPQPVTGETPAAATVDEPAEPTVEPTAASVDEPLEPTVDTSESSAMDASASRLGSNL